MTRKQTLDERYFVNSLPIPLLAPVTLSAKSIVERMSGFGYLALCFCHPVLVKCFFPYLDQWQQASYGDFESPYADKACYAQIC